MDHFNPRFASEYLQQHKVSLWIGTATMLSRCCTYAGSNFQLPRVIATSGEALSRRVLDVLESCGGCQAIFSTYGTTEIGGIALMYYLFPHASRLFSFIRFFMQTTQTITQTYSYKDFPANAQTLLLGDILPTAQVAIYDEERGCIVPDGEIGEIFAHSATAVQRYEYTSKNKLCIELNGKIYTRTGDMGCKRGHQLYLIGRKKNLIIRSGENIIPAEIEQAAACYPGILAAVACGIPSRTHGEDICLCLETDSPTLDTSALLEHLKNTLPKYMIPQHIDILDEFPIGPTGKTNVQTIQAKMAEKYPIV